MSFVPYKPLKHRKNDVLEALRFGGLSGLRDRYEGRDSCLNEQTKLTPIPSDELVIRVHTSYLFGYRGLYV